MYVPKQVTRFRGEMAQHKDPALPLYTNVTLTGNVLNVINIHNVLVYQILALTPNVNVGLLLFVYTILLMEALLLFQTLSGPVILPLAIDVLAADACVAIILNVSILNQFCISIHHCQLG